MQKTERNVFVDGPWVLRKLENRKICESFDCSDDDLNEYFHIDASLHQKELLTQSYYLHSSEYPNLALALLDFCNDSVHLEQYRDKIDIDTAKQYNHLPAVKLSRFGVQKELQSHNIGTQALNMVKKLFITDNRTGCRFLTVDAYNSSKVMNFYAKNGFQPFLDTDKDKKKESRVLFFDLKRLVGI